MKERMRKEKDTDRAFQRTVAKVSGMKLLG